MKLHDLKPNEGAKKNKKRVGRGIFCRSGEKTAGRGTKGQGARSGARYQALSSRWKLAIFQALPFVRGKGFTPINRVEYNEVNLDQLVAFPAGSEVTPVALAEARLLRNVANPVVLLGRGEVGVALKVSVHRITKGAKAKIEAAGGSVSIIEA
jgi:large subunit ribosomal protein L15